MTHVRQVTGTIHKPDGSPWPDFAIGFDVPKTAATTHATLPGTSVGASTTAHTIVTQTNASGEFSVDLEVDVTIRVTMLGALVTAGTSTRYPGESQFVIVVPDGDTPISLETIRAAAITPPDDPTLPNLVAQVASDLSDHEGDTDNPHEVTAAQVDTYTTSEIDNLINDHRPEWGNIDGDLDDQTDLASALGDKADATDLTAHTSRQDNPHEVTAAQVGTYTSGEIDNALSGKADTGAIPTELTDLDTSVTGTELDALKQAADGHGDIVTHNADEFATAAQGAKADTALQPDALTPYETSTQLNNRDTANRSRANHTGTQAISTVDGLQDSLDGKADDDAVVKLTGDQAVAGVKTFAASPVVPDPASNDEAASKAYVDDTAASVATGLATRFVLPGNNHWGSHSFGLPPTEAVGSDQTRSANNIHLSPITVPTGINTINVVAIEVTTAASESGEARIGLFAVDIVPGAMQEPRDTTVTLLAELGVIATRSTGIKSIGSYTWGDPGQLNQPVTPGTLIYVGFLPNENVGMRCTSVWQGMGQGGNVNAPNNVGSVSFLASYGPFSATYTPSSMGRTTRQLDVAFR